MSQIVIMGSGETAPTMVKLHRQILDATPAGAAVMLDTPFGFQRNADDLVTRTVGYFAESVGASIEVARWRRADAPVAEQERALALLSRASWAFAGPGSPTYALRQWTGTPVPDALADVVERGGTLVVGSAAACTVGTHAVPVYEIYKVGVDPHWLPGLDLFGRLTGVHAVVVPHFDNREGGTSHDTRFCYLGEERLAALEADLPREVGVLGVDEHTALLVDVTARTARVAGNGRVTVRRRDAAAQVFAAGAELGLDELSALLSGARVSAGPPASAVTPSPAAAAGPSWDGAEQPSLGARTRELQRHFDAALAARDVEGCVTAALDLETAIVAWGADTDQNDDAERAHRVLRTMIAALGDLAATGARDPRDVVRPYVDLALTLRARARADRDFATSDLIRDRLAAAGVEVRDTPDGVMWDVAEERAAASGG